MNRELLSKIVQDGNTEELDSFLEHNTGKIKTEEMEAMKFELVRHSRSLTDHKDCLEVLLRYDSNLNMLDSTGKSLLMLACQKGDLQIVQFLLSKKANINQLDKQKQNALFYAIDNKSISENIDVIMHLIERQIIVNQKSVCGHTPLYHAVRTNQLRVSEILLSKNADVNVVVNNENLMNIAIANKQSEMIALLIDYDINLQHYNKAIQMKCIEQLEKEGFVDQIDILNKKKDIREHLTDQKSKKNIIKIANAHKKRTSYQQQQKQQIDYQQQIQQQESQKDSNYEEDEYQVKTHKQVQYQTERQQNDQHNRQQNNQQGYYGGQNNIYRNKGSKKVQYDKQKKKGYGGNNESYRYGNINNSQQYNPNNNNQQYNKHYNSYQQSQNTQIYQQDYNIYQKDQLHKYYQQQQQNLNQSQQYQQQPHLQLQQQHSQQYQQQNQHHQFNNSAVMSGIENSSNVVEINFENQDEQRQLQQKAEIEHKKKAIKELQQEYFTRTTQIQEKNQLIIQLQQKLEQLKEQCYQENMKKNELLQKQKEKEQQELLLKEQLESEKFMIDRSIQSKYHDCDLQFQDILNGNFNGSYTKSILKTEEVSNRLHSEIEQFQKQVDQYSKQNKKVFQDLIEDIKLTIETALQNVEINIFGSFATDLCLPWSDIDVVIQTNNCENTSVYILQMIEEQLNKQDWISEQKNISAATIPVLKITCTEKYLNKKVDITIQEKKHNGLECVQLVKDLVSFYDPLKPLVLVLKQFLYKCNFNDTYQGGLSSYGLILMIVAYFQNKEQKTQQKLSRDNPNLGALLIEFFQFYGCEMDYFTKEITIYKPDQKYFQNISKHIVFSECHQDNMAPMMKLVIKDPLNILNNIGRSTFKIACIKQTMQIAYYTLFQYHSCSLENSCCFLQRIFSLPYKIMVNQNLII